MKTQHTRWWESREARLVISLGIAAVGALILWWAHGQDTYWSGVGVNIGTSLILFAPLAAVGLWFETRAHEVWELLRLRYGDITARQTRGALDLDLARVIRDSHPLNQSYPVPGQETEDWIYRSVVPALQERLRKELDQLASDLGLEKEDGSFSDPDDLPSGWVGLDLKRLRVRHFKNRSAGLLFGTKVDRDAAIRKATAERQDLPSYPRVAAVLEFLLIGEADEPARQRIDLISGVSIRDAGGGGTWTFRIELDMADPVDCAIRIVEQLREVTNRTGPTLLLFATQLRVPDARDLRSESTQPR